MRDKGATVERYISTEFGYCYYDVERSSPLVYNLFIESTFRGSGRARQLLSLVILQIRQLGFDGVIEIQAAPFGGCGLDAGKLTSFYESMGLKVIAGKNKGAL